MYELSNYLLQVSAILPYILINVFEPIWRWLKSIILFCQLTNFVLKNFVVYKL